MTRFTSIIAAALTAATTLTVTAVAPGTAVAGETVYIDGNPYEYQGLVALGEGATTIVDSLHVARGAAAPQPKGCRPTSKSITIHDPSAKTYYGIDDTLYFWTSKVVAEVDGCPNNTVTVSGQMTDQALDGSSLPAHGEVSTGRGRGRAEADVHLVQKYSNVAMAGGQSYHALTVRAWATESDGTTTTSWCASRTFTYLATAVGPIPAGSTPYQSC